MLDKVSKDYFAFLWYFKHNNHYLREGGKQCL